jgi:cell division protease FtsH
LSGDVDLGVIAKSVPGLVGADLANLVNEGAILAARKNKKSISMRDFEEAIERVILGPERKSRIISKEEREVIAYHEAGHAVVMHMLPKCDPVRKITIVSRGMAGGVTWSMPDDDSFLGSKTEFMQDIAGTLGGRAAEAIVFGEITNGASNDLETITRRSRQMITRWGMSEKLGPRVFGKTDDMIFLGREISEQRDYSEKVAQQIDEEVHDMVVGQYEVAVKILTENRDKLDAVAQRLLEVETIGREEFVEIMDGGSSTDTPSSSGAVVPPSAPQPQPGTDRGELPNIGTAPSPA